MSRGHFSQGVSQDVQPYLAIGAGKVPKASHHNINVAGPVSTEQLTMLNPMGIATYVWPLDTGESMTLSAVEAADTGITALITGLDAELKQKTIEVTLLGTTAVPIGTWSRITDCTNVSPGEQPSVGQVNIRGTGARVVNIYGGWSAQHQAQFMGVYSTPTDKLAQILQVTASVLRSQGNTGTSVTFSLRARQVGRTFVSVFPFGLQSTGSSTVQLLNIIPDKLDGAWDFELFAFSSATSVVGEARLVSLLQDY